MAYEYLLTAGVLAEQLNTRLDDVAPNAPIYSANLIGSRRRENVIPRSLRIKTTRWLFAKEAVEWLTLGIRLQEKYASFEFRTVATVFEFAIREHVEYAEDHDAPPESANAEEIEKIRQHIEKAMLDSETPADFSAKLEELGVARAYNIRNLD